MLLTLLTTGALTLAPTPSHEVDLAPPTCPQQVQQLQKENLKLRKKVKELNDDITRIYDSLNGG